MAKKGRKTRTVYRRVRSRIGKAKIPIIPAMFLASIPLSVVNDKAGYPKSTLGYALGGSWESAGNVAGKALMNPKNYVIPVAGLIVCGIARKFLGRFPVGKRVTAL